MSKPAGQRVYLHIGAPKTGTTYLQDVLWRNRNSLARAGVLYPGDRPDAHFRAAMDLQEKQFQADWVDPNVRGAWARLVAEARQWSGDVVVSHELFCTADRAQIDRALSDLEFAEIHLVCTARDLARQLPAVWQEDIKNRHMLSFTEFMEGVSGSVQPTHWLSELFWARQDLPGILAKWSRVIPSHRVHVVTVPPRDQPFGLLWGRLAELVGIDPEHYDSAGGALNKSLGVPETELLHRLNKVLEGRLSWPQYDSVVKGQLVTRIFGSRKPRIPLELPDEYRAWAHDQSERLVTELAKADYEVLGDLQDLVPTSPTQATHHPDHADEREVLDVAVEGLAGLIERVAADENKPQPPVAPQGVRQTLSHLCNQHVVLSRMRRLYRRLKVLKRPQ